MQNNKRKGDEKAKEQEQRKQRNLIIYGMYLLLVVCVIAYILTGLAVVGLAAFILIIVIILVEFRSSIKSEGGRKTLIDVAGAVIVAVLVFWVIPSIILQTSAPINVVASCSMLPVLQRGELILLHGTGNMSSFLSTHDIPIVNVTQQQYSTMVNNMQDEFVEPFFYFNNNPSDIASTTNSTAPYSIGFYSLSCIASQGQRQVPDYAQCRLQSQSSNLIKYNYALANVTSPSGTSRIVYVPSIVIGNTTVVENYSNPIIVYKTTSMDYFSGDIIHRLFAAIRVGKQYYLLTKGDNNAILDIESLNYPINASNSVLGYVVAGVPYLGYPSLIIKGQIGSVPGCNQTIVRS